MHIYFEEYTCNKGDCGCPPYIKIEFRRKSRRSMFLTSKTTTDGYKNINIPIQDI